MAASECPVEEGRAGKKAYKTLEVGEVLTFSLDGLGRTRTILTKPASPGSLVKSGG
jgi:hypothetical protein